MAQGKTSGQIDAKEQAAPWGSTGNAGKNYSSALKDGKEDKTKKSNPYGSWGPVFKDKNNFASMHHC